MLESVRYLLKLDQITVDGQDEEGDTPLRLAAVGGHSACVMAILERSDPGTVWLHIF